MLIDLYTTPRRRLWLAVVFALLLGVGVTLLAFAG